MVYDFIGDIHGFIDPLRNLLLKLDYTQVNEYLWKPPQNHQAIFIGDYIDRGKSSIDVLKTVKAMVDRTYAKAILGNHEYNAILYHTKKKNSTEYMRSHSELHKKQHKETLIDFENHHASIDTWIEWFKTLPLYIETDNIIAIHACPEINAFNILKNHPLIVNSRLTDEFIHLAAEKTSDEYSIIECLLKGPEQDLPNGVTITDAEKHIRKEVRCKWWALLNKAEIFTNWSQIALSIDADAMGQLSELPLLPEDLAAIKEKVAVPDDKMIFVGHYWESGEVQMKNKRVVCLDYSIAKGGQLVGFSYDKDKIPSNDCFEVIR